MVLHLDLWHRVIRPRFVPLTRRALRITLAALLFAAIAFVVCA